ncbi:type VI secretion system tube protein TssD [Chitinophaga sp. Hz27]|uniref:type VI secretion system tube protein TssD n=1 Tax=Chitinophaga sp. Hz27 TaxID=3347169 RepID=UPI0035DC0AAC
MSFKARCTIDGLDFNVLECRYSFLQNTDSCGRPNAKALANHIELLLESSSDTTLLDWMISDTVTHSGSIVFYRRDALSRLKELKFSDTYCIGYTENFNAANEQPMQIKLILSARKIQVNNSTYEHQWPA